MFSKRADGGGVAELLVSDARATSWSSDGRFLAFNKNGDIWVLDFEGERTTRPFVETPYRETTGMFSPDGRFMAYASFETGRWEVYVQPFPGATEKLQVSTEGGANPRWNPRGGELFYRNGSRWMAVDIAVEPSLRAGKPRLLFEGPYSPSYDVAQDGEAFLVIDPRREGTEPTQINIVLNWLDELGELVPTDD